MSLSIHVESPRRVPVRKALKTDRVLKFGHDVIRVHSIILDQSKPLRAIVKAQGAKVTYNVDVLKREHGLLSTAGLRYAIDFMYGQTLDVSLHKLYDLFAAAHALDLSDLLDALRAELIKLSRDPTTALFALEHAYNHLSPPAEETAANAALLLASVYEQEWCAVLTPVAFAALLKEASYLCPLAVDIDVYVCTILDWLAANRKEITLARTLLSRIDLHDASPAQNTRIRYRILSLSLLKLVGGALSLALGTHCDEDVVASSPGDQRSPSSSLLDVSSARSTSLSEQDTMTARNADVVTTDEKATDAATESLRSLQSKLEVGPSNVESKTIIAEIDRILTQRQQGPPQIAPMLIEAAEKSIQDIASSFFASEIGADAYWSAMKSDLQQEDLSGVDVDIAHVSLVQCDMGLQIQGSQTVVECGQADLKSVRDRVGNAISVHEYRNGRQVTFTLLYANKLDAIRALSDVVAAWPTMPRWQYEPTNTWQYLNNVPAKLLKEPTLLATLLGSLPSSITHQIQTSGVIAFLCTSLDETKRLKMLLDRRQLFGTLMYMSEH